MPRGVGEQIVTVVAATASGNSGGLPVGYGTTTARIQLNVTAASGTSPTLNVIVEDTLDGTNWNTIGTFAQKTAVSREVINISTPFANQLRVAWTIGGTTPSFSFNVNWVVQ